MPLKVFPLAPYYDDFNQEKNYQRILFKPGYSVQARELTQLQTSIQAQIDRFGRHVFKEGSSVIGGEASLDSSFAFIKIESNFPLGSDTYDSEEASANKNFVGRTLTGKYSGITAVVIDSAPYVDDSNPLTLYIHYKTSNTKVDGIVPDPLSTTPNPQLGVDKTFYAGEIIEVEQKTRAPGDQSPIETQDLIKVKPANTNPIGKGTRVTVTEGVFFVSGNFVHTPQNSVILSRYNSFGSGRIVYSVTEGVVTAGSGANSSLFDNSQGTPNEAAPGADRYQISLDLQVQDYQFKDRTENNIIQLMVVKDGRIISKARTEYSVLADILAQRTFEESGNYTVRPFQAAIRQYLNANNNGGLYTAEQIQSLVPAFNRGSLSASAYGEKRLAFGLEPSTAYVNGYRVELLDTKYVEIPKARETATFQDAGFNAVVGNYVIVQLTNAGYPDINTFAQFDLKNSSSTIIGTASARAIEREGSNYRLYLFNVKMASGSSFEAVREFGNFATTSTATFNNVTNNSLVFKLPFDVVDHVSDVSHNILKQYSPVRSGNVLTITTDVGETLDFENDPIVIDGSGAAVSVNDFSTNASSKTITLTTTPDSNTYQVYAKTRVTNSSANATAKTKTLTQTTKSLSVGSINSGNRNENIPLGQTDLFKIINIVETVSASTKDITNDFIVDNGQRDNFYDEAKIRLKPTANLPVGSLIITFQYFAHGAGSFFTRNSYSANAGLNFDGYSQIPAFQSTKGLIQLRDAIDFRPSLLTPTTFSGKMIDPNSLITADIRYYLSRADKIYVDKNGNFGYVEGISSISPVLPEDPKDAMVLYTVRLNAFTFNSDDIIPTMIDNKRYTMRDIGKIEKRVAKLEYYTALSLLEKDTNDRDIRDDNGVSRFKNGFIVDAFHGHSIGAVTHPDYRCSIDKANGRLRPSFKQDNVRLKWNKTSPSTKNVRQSSSLITLDYTQQAIIQQPYASIAENVNPYNVFTWTGDMTLSPESDEWKETKRRPEVVIDQSGTYDSLKFGLDESSVIGTVWNDWQTNWSGVVDQSAVTNVDNDYNSYKQTSTTTLTTTTRKEQARTGIRTSVVPDTVTTQLGDRTVEINFVPFIRSRKIFFKAEGLKPLTRLHAFFDNTPVDQFVKQENFVFYSERTDSTDYSNKTNHPDYVSTDVLMTDAAGRISGSFVIPVNNVVKFKTGVRMFSLSDDPTNNKLKQSTGTQAAYDARGVIETKENLVVSTRVPRIRREETGENRTIVDSSKETSAAEANLPRPPLPPNTIVSPPLPPLIIPSIPPTGVFQADFQAHNSTGGLSVSFNGNSSGNIIRDVSFNDELSFPIVAVPTNDHPNGPYEFWYWQVNSGNVQIGSGLESDKYVATTNVRILSAGLNVITAIFRLTGVPYVEPTIIDPETTPCGPDPVVQPPGGWYPINEWPWIKYGVGAPDQVIDPAVEIGPIPASVQEEWVELPEEYITEIVPPDPIIVETAPEEILNSDEEYVQTGEPEAPITIEAAEDPWQWSVEQGFRPEVCWKDPLAQSFLIDMPGGAFITSLDLYFKSKDGNVPITLEMRVMENGIPTPRVVPFSTVKAYPADISISGNATAATRFNFEAPVYLLQNVEYCFVLISNSDQYEVWVSEIGGFDVTNPAFRITSQPYIGVLFKSQNASTWTPDQTKDIKFNLNRAVFYSSGKVELNEVPLPSEALNENPLFTTSGSPNVIVTHRNHGHVNGSNVLISGATAVGGFTTTVLNATHAVSDVEADSYKITMASNATATLIGGGSAVTASGNKMFDVLNPIVQSVVLPGTDLYWKVKTTSGKSLAGSETFGAISGESFIQPNDATFFNSPQVILSDTEKTRELGSSANSSFSLTGEFVSLRNNLSPVIDLDRLSLITVSNRIDNPVASTTANCNVVRNYVAEISATGGSALAKYITRKVELNNDANSLRVFFLANRPSSTNIELYYKVQDQGSDVDFEALGWVKAEPINPIPINDDVNDYSEIEYDVSDTDITTDNFRSFAIKIVFTASNSARVPTIREFRAIAVT